MAPRKKAAPKTAATPTKTTRDDFDAATGVPRGDEEQQIAVDDGTGPEPHEVNDNLASDRMKALLEDHRAMGARPG